MRRWSGWGQLKPLPCTTSMLVTQQVKHELLVVLDRIDLGQAREHVQRARGCTQVTPGICLSAAIAASRCSRSRPPGSTRS